MKTWNYVFEDGAEVATLTFKTPKHKDELGLIEKFFAQKLSEDGIMFSDILPIDDTDLVEQASDCCTGLVAVHKPCIKLK